MDQIKDNILKKIFYFFNEGIDDFIYNLTEFIGWYSLKKDILRHQTKFMKKFKKELRKKKYQDKLLQMFLSQNLDELNLNPGFEYNNY